MTDRRRPTNGTAPDERKGLTFLSPSSGTVVPVKRVLSVAVVLAGRVTAAHCLGGGGGLVFVPGYRNGRAPQGQWKVRRLFLPRGWAEGRHEDRFVTGTATGATGVTVTGFGGGTSGSPWGNGDGQVVGVLGGHDRGGTGRPPASPAAWSSPRRPSGCTGGRRGIRDVPRPRAPAGAVVLRPCCPCRAPFLRPPRLSSL